MPTLCGHFISSFRLGFKSLYYYDYTLMYVEITLTDAVNELVV